jgi:hypothetical protein
MEQGLVNQLAQPVNNVAQSFEARTGALQKQHADEAAVQRQKDDDTLKVFEFAADGKVDEARLYARNKGIVVPEEIITNADFSKGLTLAGNLYSEDPAAAQKFTTAWMQNRNSDFQTRMAAAQSAGGPWKRKTTMADSGFNLAPGQSHYNAAGQVVASVPGNPPISRFEAGQRAAQAAMQGGMASSQEIAQARTDAEKAWDSAFGQTYGGASQGLINTGVSPNPEPMAAAEPQIPTELPPGSVMIGTSNGFPVYQTPNGDRFIKDGTP